MTQLTSKQIAKQNMSKQLDEMRNLAIIITNDKNIKIKYDTKFPTCCFDYETNTITLTTNNYPDWVKNIPRLVIKMLDSSCAHEAGHKKMSKPLVKYVEKWIEQLGLSKNGLIGLAREVINVVEDKRVNYFIKNRYRFDIGKRQELKELIFADYINNNVPLQIMKAVQSPNGVASVMVGCLGDCGIYGADVTPFLAVLTQEQQDDLKKCLKLLNDVQYKSLRIDVVNTYKEIYTILHKHIKIDDNLNQLMIPYDGGKLQGDLSDKLKQKLMQLVEEEEKQEQKKEELEKDLQKGNGAGEGTGNEIPAPEQDPAKYEDLVNDVKPQIDRLLGKLKQIMKPQVKREIYQKRGRIMSNLTSRSYVNSLVRPVTNVYIQNSMTLEKEKVCIGMGIDFSGSVDHNTALKITTTLTEVFGNYVEDYGFAVGVFAEDYQRIKTFFETFANTRARIPNVSVNSSGTRLHDMLEAFLKMFNAIHENRRKIMVIASDFCLSDTEECTKILEMYQKSGIELIFFGFDYCDIKRFAPNLKAKRIKMEAIQDLPEDFIQVYIESQNGKGV